jgi:undecaprenyl phosphate N,N'-diacetylbacillosamine 1-phosphate transferase
VAVPCFIHIYRKVIKPVLDIVLAVIALTLLSPIFVLVPVMIKIDSKGPVFFRQERLGRNGSVFRIYKFRSMVSDQTHYEKPIKIYESDPRITRAGRLIRKTSIDEIPQLLNILKGEMSFIGPRPPLTWFPKRYDEYSDFEKQRFQVKPGISGLAQTQCREIHDWEVKIPVDVEYVLNYTFSYDLKLFFRSLISVFKTNQVYRRD